MQMGEGRRGASGSRDAAAHSACMHRTGRIVLKGAPRNQDRSPLPPLRLTRRVLLVWHLLLLLVRFSLCVSSFSAGLFQVREQEALECVIM